VGVEAGPEADPGADPEADLAQSEADAETERALELELERLVEERLSEKLIEHTMERHAAQLREAALEEQVQTLQDDLEKVREQLRRAERARRDADEQLEAARPSSSGAGVTDEKREAARVGQAAEPPTEAIDAAVLLAEREQGASLRSELDRMRLALAGARGQEAALRAQLEVHEHAAAERAATEATLERVRGPKPPPPKLTEGMAALTRQVEAAAEREKKLEAEVARLTSQQMRKPAAKLDLAERKAAFLLRRGQALVGTMLVRALERAQIYHLWQLWVRFALRAPAPAPAVTLASWLAADSADAVQSPAGGAQADAALGDDEAAALADKVRADAAARALAREQKRARAAVERAGQSEMARQAAKLAGQAVHESPAKAPGEPTTPDTTPGQAEADRRAAITSRYMQ